MQHRTECNPHKQSVAFNEPQEDLLKANASDVRKIGDAQKQEDSTIGKQEESK